MEPKFKTGDNVKVIKYGSLMWVSKQDFKKYSEQVKRDDFVSKMKLLYNITPTQDQINSIQGDDSPKNIYKEGDDMWIVDVCPELVGQQGIVEKSTNTQNQIKYALQGVKGKYAWYDEGQLKLSDAPKT
jgi:hypothetical protein